jgi:hypothetical protein
VRQKVGLLLGFLPSYSARSTHCFLFLFLFVAFTPSPAKLSHFFLHFGFSSLLYIVLITNRFFTLFLIKIFLIKNACKMLIKLTFLKLLSRQEAISMFHVIIEFDLFKISLSSYWWIHVIFSNFVICLIIFCVMMMDS